MKVISPLYTFMFRIVYEFEKSSSNGFDEKCLLTLCKKELVCLDENKWAPYITRFKEDLIGLATPEERTILFLIYSINLDQISETFLSLTPTIAHVFSLTDVNPHNYKLYLKMLEDNDIVNLLFSSLSSDFTSLLSTMIAVTPMEKLIAQNYEDAKRFLCTIINHHYSPIFANYYTIDNVYETLKYIIEDERYSLAISHTEKQRILSKMPTLKSLYTDEFGVYFQNSIRELESRFSGHIVTLVKKIAERIPELLSVARQMYFRDNFQQIVNIIKPI